MSATIVTIHGNLVSQPEYLRVGPQDRQLTKLRIASCLLYTSDAADE